MAFVAEVKAKLGLDTTDFQRALTKTTADLGRIGNETERKLRRSFGGDDAIKGLLQGMGIGSVEQIADLVQRPFRMAMERAQAMVGMTGQLRDIQTKEIGALRGPVAALGEMERDLKGVSREMEIQQKLIEDLKANPLTYISPTALGLLQEAEAELRRLTVEQANLNSQIKIKGVLDRRQQADASKQLSLESDLSDIDIRRGSEREKTLRTMRFLQEQYRTLRQRFSANKAGATRTPEEAANLSAMNKATDKLRELDAKAREERRVALVTMGAAAATGRKPQSRARGRTEAERIADRGEQSKFLAEQAVLRGDRGAAREHSINAARDLSIAGQKIAMGSSEIPPEISRALQSPLLSAAASLKNIEANLAPEKIQ